MAWQRVSATPFLCPRHAAKTGTHGQAEDGGSTTDDLVECHERFGGVPRRAWWPAIPERVFLDSP
jgi:hypothetical protein